MTTDMPLNLCDYEPKAAAAVKAFWASRAAAVQRQVDAGKLDTGGRAGVTAGKNMDAFIDLIVEVVRANGLADAEMHQQRSVLTLPGYYRPTKLWDLLVIHRGQLIAAIELKSQVGPSFGNNFNNRTEEAIGTAHDLWTAYREGAFGQQPRPFVGWLMLVEDAEGSRSPVRDRSPHFPVFKAFDGASYLKRYDLLCQRMLQEQLYTAAAVLTATRDAEATGQYGQQSDMTNLKTFIATLAGHVATVAARLSA
jgi:hypothetical protein